MSSNQLPEVVVGFAAPPHPRRISKQSRKYCRDKHQLRQESMPVIPVNQNHPTASAAGKQTPNAAVCKSPPRAAKAQISVPCIHIGDNLAQIKVICQVNVQTFGSNVWHPNRVIAAPQIDSICGADIKMVIFNVYPRNITKKSQFLCRYADKKN